MAFGSTSNLSYSASGSALGFSGASVADQTAVSESEDEKRKRLQAVAQAQARAAGQSSFSPAAQALLGYNSVGGNYGKL